MNETPVSRTTFFVGFALVACLAAFNLFWRLDTVRVSGFDEARHGVTAYEMVRDGEFILTTYRGTPDYWNLKPPLGAWLIAASYNVLGHSTLALRAPAALSALCCVLVVMLVLRQRGMPLAGLIAGLILATMYRFMGWHAGRTGDYDAQLACIICLAVACLERPRPTMLSCAMLGLAMACSFLLKSFAAIYTIGVVGTGTLVLLCERKIRIKHLVVMAACAAVPVAAWAVTRYYHDGLKFFQMMIEYDLKRRSSVSIEGHVGGYDYYLIKMLLDTDGALSASFWLILLCLAGILLLLWRRSVSIRDLRNYPMDVAWFAVPLLIASLVKSKASWYLNPAYPGLAVLLGMGFAAILGAKTVGRGARWSVGICLAAILVYAEARVVDKIRAGLSSSLQPFIASLSAHASSNTVLYSSFWVPAPHPKEKGDKLFDWNQAAVFAAEAIGHLRVGDASNVHHFLSLATLDDLLLENTNTAHTIPPGLLDVVTNNGSYVVWRRTRTPAPENKAVPPQSKPEPKRK